VADDDSLTMLGYLIARVEEHPVLVAVATRTGESGAAVAEAVLAGAAVQAIRSPALPARSPQTSRA
jgi:hypothetical protein